MDNIIYRIANDGDVEKINNLFAELFEYDEQFDGALNLNWPVQFGVEYFKRKIKEDFVILGLDGEEVVAALVGEIQKPVYFWRRFLTAELLHVYVKFDFRGKGIGEKMSSLFFDWCKNKKVEMVYVTYSTANIKAGKFYEKTGFNNLNTTLQKKL